MFKSLILLAVYCHFVIKNITKRGLHNVYYVSYDILLRKFSEKEFKMRRMKINSRRGRRLFRKLARRTHRVNRRISRGGFRL